MQKKGSSACPSIMGNSEAQVCTARSAWLSHLQETRLEPEINFPDFLAYYTNVLRFAI